MIYGSSFTSTKILSRDLHPELRAFAKLLRQLAPAARFQFVTGRNILAGFSRLD